MSNLVLHVKTLNDVTRFSSRPTHALLLVAPSGSGKLSLARHIASQILKISLEEFSNYPYALTISPQDGRAISIDAIRELQHFTTLKIPGEQTISRVVIIESADLLTLEAQNALLKTLEEPPADTVFILTAGGVDSLLPTIQSRVRLIKVLPPPLEDLKIYLNASYAPQDIDKALLVSGGLPGLSVALLDSSETHPLYEATVIARQILGSKVYERLLLVDSLSKQKQLCADIVFILGQMTHMALTRSVPTNAQRWQTILRSTYRASEHLRQNTQTKLVLINLMLEI
jgi:DNA polymerase-3 subunit delta'